MARQQRDLPRDHAQLWASDRGGHGRLVIGFSVCGLRWHVTEWPRVIDLGAGSVVEHQEAAHRQGKARQNSRNFGITASGHALLLDKGGATGNVLRRHGLLPGRYLFYPDHISLNFSVRKVILVKRSNARRAVSPASLAPWGLSASTRQSPAPALPAGGGPTPVRRTVHRAGDTATSLPALPRLTNADAPPSAG